MFLPFLEFVLLLQRWIRIDLEATELSEARLHRFKGHLVMPSEARLDIFVRAMK